MQRYFNVDVLDLWRGKLSLRKLRVLLTYLPADSLAARQIAGFDDELSQWSLGDVLLARVSDELALFRWEWESAHLAKGQRARKQPDSVLPQRRSGTNLASPARDADVIPLVSPHSLGSFIHDDGSEHGD